MASEIPFVDNASDVSIFNRYHQDSGIVRLTLDRAKEWRGKFKGNPKLWLDAAVDGYDHLLARRKVSPTWDSFRKAISEGTILSRPDSWNRPSLQRIASFVADALDKCNEFRPHWMTVPQLPVVDDAKRNWINRELATAASAWKSSRSFRGKLILPLIFTNGHQLRGKAVWKKKLDAAERCSVRAEVDGVWVVDASLSDQDGTGTFTKRFGKLVDFHKDLRKRLPDRFVVAGPYWGMNLILWTQGLCDYPAITLGRKYRYYIPGGGHGRKPKVRVAIPPLRRWASAGPLKTWLGKALDRVDSQDPAYSSLLKLKADIRILTSVGPARRQVGQFYKRWLDELAAVPKPGRALALFQNLSTAFVLGKQLPVLSGERGTARHPAIVAQQFMVNCL